MEFVGGPTLAEWLSGRPRPPAPGTAAGLLVRLADAIHHAHDQGGPARRPQAGERLARRPAGRGG